MNLEYYRSEKGIYVARQNTGYLNRREKISSHREILINGVAPESTSHVSWLFVPNESELKQISEKTTGEKYNYRWELNESAPELVKKELPLTLSLEQSCEYYDDDEYEYYIGSKCDQHEYRGFYTRKNDTKPDYFKEVDINIKLLGEIKSNWAKNPTDAKYSVWNGSYKSDGVQELSIASIASFSELSSMMTPDLLLHNQPCSISSEQTYKIVRKHISDNIDSKWAKITSDYDFCFTVKKKIAIKPITKKNEITKSNGRSYAKPRFKTHTTTHLESEIFEMTHAKRNYSGYSCITGFKGDNLQDLINNIEMYLTELMEYINEPLSQCSHCSGTGHIFNEGFNKNNR